MQVSCQGVPSKSEKAAEILATSAVRVYSTSTLLDELDAQKQSLGYERSSITRRRGSSLNEQRFTAFTGQLLVNNVCSMPETSIVLDLLEVRNTTGIHASTTEDLPV